MRDWHGLVETHYSMIAVIARRLKCTLPACVDVDDLVGAGHLGLIAAAQRFDPMQAVTFRVFARKRILGSMLDWLRSDDHVPRQERRRLSRDPNNTQGFLMSLDTGFENLDWTDIIESRTPCPRAIAESKEWPAVFRGLSDIEQRIVELRYRMGYTLGEIANALHLSECRISQMHTKIAKRWREWHRRTSASTA